MTTYYNENDPYAAAWLRNLVAEGLIAPGDVDDRDIRDVRPDDLRGYHQCHFFAGIGIWSAACRRAGIPDDYPLWTGSCPCQPFSASGRRHGFADERHLWPHWFWLISQCRPRLIYGEQVASKDGLAWFDLVSADLEGAGYTGWVADLCSAGVGAPNIRQRLFFVAEHTHTHTHRRLGEPERSRLERYPRHGDETSGWTIEAGSVATTGATRRVDYTFSLGRGARRHDDAEYDRIVADANHLARRLADADLIGPGEEGIQRSGEFAGLGRDPRHSNGDARCPGPTNGFWRDADWLFCRDGKWRPVGPGTFPLAHGASARVGRLRAYGNAINLEVATEFIRSHRDALAYRGLHRSSADIV